MCGSGLIMLETGREGQEERQAGRKVLETGREGQEERQAGRKTHETGPGILR